MQFGVAPFFLVEAPLSPAQETTLEPNPDFFTVPGLDVVLTGVQVTAVQTRLENNGVAGQWVTSSLTWRQVLRKVSAIFMIAQRANVNLTQASLDLRMNQLNAAVRTRLEAASDSLGFDRSSITANTLVRTTQSVLADQWNRPLNIGSVRL
jgi:hypothetical protein